jgi:hypothetical protein
MQTPHERTLNAGRRVQVFLDTFAAIIGALISPALRAKFDAAVAALAGFRLEQTTAAGLVAGETANQQRLRTELYDRFVLPVLRVAKLLLADVPQYPNLIVPRSAITRVDFIPTIQKFREAAAANEAVLVAHVMPADFLAALDAAIAAIETSADFRARQQARRKAATQGCVDGFKTLRGYIGIIDAALRPFLLKNPALLRDWQASKSVRQSPVNPLPTGSLDPTMDDSGGTTATENGGSAGAVTEDPTPDTGTPVHGGA